MKVLILGANGMLGHDLMEVFGTDKASYQVSGTDKDVLDITDSAQIDAYFDENKPEIVINAAAYTAVDDCEKNEDLASLINGEAVRLLARKCKQINATFIHISTDYVFDGEKTGGYKEDDEVDPMNAYGRSKLLGEASVQKDCDKYYLIRTSWLYGRHGKNFVDTMIALANAGKVPLRVVNDQRGKPTYSKDLAKHIKLLIESNAEFGTYHFSNENDVTWYEFAKDIFSVANINVEVLPVTSEEFPRPAKRPHISTLINTKFPLMRAHTEALKDYLGSK
ncbi:MAG: dTDP-4-dehydrorhamnose reductase, RfbD, dTDP-4-dehydrorhamnose reductase [Candidatus Peregrinibacteria bacterium GW2011_GWF2_38_29]|nr:MAG: dTDP-4-dehydrorhamnose reductase, RfbD, dTDP-4-dehydrorhamnose reductase [Candidatus Peregrinibacteria bacterium GW2011_GWF2_38_29]HBB02906.1 dTDP-4-dehydrorhamnose reductase [Candidatus Peregrinibacteria bacterium]